MNHCSNLLTTLQTLVGADHVLTDSATIAPYLTDWRKRYTGKAQAVVKPANTAEVAAVVQACYAAAAPIVPQGGNTGLVGGATPNTHGDAVVLSLQRMNRIRELDVANNTVTVEAGCILQTLQQAARTAERLFPLSLASEGSATLGGNLSSNAGGTQVLRYGNTRDLTLGLEVVLPSGEIWNGLRALRKDNTGYDLKHLFIGAEGTLGVITAAVMKLFPLPAAQMTALAALPSLAAAVSLLNQANAQCGANLTAFEVMSAECLGRVQQQFPTDALPLPAERGAWFALLELSSAQSQNQAQQLLETVLEHAIEANTAIDAVVAQSLTEAAALWQLRERIPEAQARAGGNVKHDISLPVSAIPRFVSETNQRLRERFDWIEPVIFGHLGDGNLHYNMATRQGVAATQALSEQEQINRVVHDAVVRWGGSISAEHGLGQAKNVENARYKSTVELNLMRTIKQALDPRGLMNPGKVL